MTFCPVYCWDLPREVDQQITVEDLRAIDHVRYGDAQAILVRTGFWRMRDIAREDYTERNPVVDPKAATFLRSRHPALRLVGIDTISIANAGQKDAGRACHREFLCNDPPILILEDADLSDEWLIRNSFELILYPMIIGKIEATPVVALAEPILAKGEHR
jgi:kynurenine formamidase